MFLLPTPLKNSVAQRDGRVGAWVWRLRLHDLDFECERLCMKILQMASQVI